LVGKERMGRIGLFLKEKENILNQKLGEEILNWETWKSIKETLNTIARNFNNSNTIWTKPLLYHLYKYY
jgi:hypothetical protein